MMKRRRITVFMSLIMCGNALISRGDEEGIVTHETPGDFDGDGQMDRGCWRSDGVWELDFAADGLGTPNVRLAGCGDRSMAAEAVDVNGDGKTDLRLRVTATELLVDFADGGFGRWDAHEVTTPPAGQRIRALLGTDMVHMLEQAGEVVPVRLVLPTVSVVDVEVPEDEGGTSGGSQESDADIPAPDTGDSPHADSPVGTTPATDGNRPRPEPATIEGSAVEFVGRRLNAAEQSLWRSLLLADASYVFDVIKRRPFLPTHAFRLKQGDKPLDVLLDVEGAMLRLVRDGQRITLNCDRAMPRWQLLTARIVPATSPTPQPEQEPNPCAE